MYVAIWEITAGFGVKAEDLESCTLKSSGRTGGVLLWHYWDRRSCSGSGLCQPLVVSQSLWTWLWPVLYEAAGTIISSVSDWPWISSETWTREMRPWLEGGESQSLYYSWEGTGLACMVARGQHMAIACCFPPLGAQALNSGLQAWSQSFYPASQFRGPILSFWIFKNLHLTFENTWEGFTEVQQSNLKWNRNRSTGDNIWRQK